VVRVMGDLISIVSSVLLFVAGAAYVEACRRLQ